MSASAEIRFGEGGATVHSYIRLTASTHIQCCTYDETAPILTIRDGVADITITNPGKGEVTEEDVALGRLLAQAAAIFAAELDNLAARNGPAAVGPDSAVGAHVANGALGNPEIVCGFLDGGPAGLKGRSVELVAAPRCSGHAVGSSGGVGAGVASQPRNSPE